MVCRDVEVSLAEFVFWLCWDPGCVCVVPFSVRLTFYLLCSPCGVFFEFIVTSIAVVLFPRAVGLQGIRLRRGVKMLRLVRWQGLQNARLGHVTLLYGSCMPRFCDSPAVKFVRLGLLVHLGTIVGVYFIYF